MLFRQVLNDDLACASYVISCGDEAVVVDPRWDIDEYLRLAEYHGFRIAHVVEHPRPRRPRLGPRTPGGRDRRPDPPPRRLRRRGPAPRPAARRHPARGRTEPDRARHPGAPAGAHEPGRDRPRPVAAPGGDPDRRLPAGGRRGAAGPGRGGRGRRPRPVHLPAPHRDARRPRPGVAGPTWAARSAAAAPSAAAPCPPWRPGAPGQPRLRRVGRGRLRDEPDRDAAAAPPTSRTWCRSTATRGSPPASRRRSRSGTSAA